MDHVRRRQFLSALGALAVAPVVTRAQQAKRALRLAFLDDLSEEARQQHWQAFLARLSQLGYVEGKNLHIDRRTSSSAAERLPSLAAELVALKPDILVAAGTVPTSAAIKATTSIPVVFVGPGDPVGAGLVGSLAHPGRNATGTSFMSSDLGGKWFE